MWGVPDSPSRWILSGLSFLLLAFGAAAQDADRLPHSLKEAREWIAGANTGSERARVIDRMHQIRTPAARELLFELLAAHQDAETRAAVYRQLGFHQHRSALQRLTDDLGTCKVAAVLDAVAAGLRGQGKKGKAVLVDALRAKRFEVAAAAVGALRHETEDKAVVAALTKAYDRSAPELKARILDALGVQKDKAEVARLCLRVLAREKDVRLCATALRRLGSCPGKAVFAALQKAFESAGNEELRRAAAEGLAGQGRAGMALLVEALGAKDAATQRTAAHGLGTGEKSIERLRALIAAFDRAAPGNRENVLRAMAGYDENPALTDLRLRALDADAPGVRAEAVLQLAEAGHPAVRDVAVPMAEDPQLRKNPRDRGRVLYALGTVLERRMLPLFLQLAGSLDWNTRHQVGRLLRGKGNRVLSILGTYGLTRDDPAERLIAAELLAGFESRESSEFLLRALRDADPRVVTLACRTLAKRRDERVATHLEGFLGSADPDVRLQAVRLLHGLRKGAKAWPHKLLEILRNSQGPVRLAALDLLAELQHQPALPVAQGLLADPAWQVRSAACGFCARVRDKTSIPLLIARLPEESGRLRFEVLAALTSLTRMTYREPDQWRGWWEAEAKTFVLPPAPPNFGQSAVVPGVMTYYSIPLTSNAVCFVLDTSGSMGAKVGTARITRLQAAQVALGQVLEKCAPEFRFNLLPFDDDVHPWRDALAQADEANKAEARKFIVKLFPRGGTNVYDALRAALKDQTVDTIYLLSDGQPSAGRLTNPDELADEVLRWNSGRRIQIHTISIGEDSPLMRRLAADSGGTYVRRI